MIEKMYEYYVKQDVQLIYVDFSSDVEFFCYVQLCKNVFFCFLLLLVLFQGKEVFEFGLDIGENFIVFV